MANWSYDPSYRLTSPFGPRIHPVTHKPHFHTGVDLVKSHKAPIGAFVAGLIVHAGEGKKGTGFGNMGNVVAVKDDRGCLHCYVHLDSVSVMVGQVVERGQEIGKQGNTGLYSTGSHLHYEIRRKASPSYGWIVSEVDRCYEPTQYLIDYYKSEEEQSMTAEEKKEFKALEQRVKETEEKLEKLTNEEQQIPAPPWFVDEFKSDDLGGLVKDPDGHKHPAAWEAIAIAARLQGMGKGKK